MTIDRDNAFEIRDDGLLFENGAHLSSGSAVPTHTAPDGDRYFQTNGIGFIRIGGEWVTEANAFTGASPGFVFGNPGTVTPGSYLDNGRNPSNIVGAPIDIGGTPKLTKVSVLNKTSQIYSITIQEHDQSTFTDIITVVVTPAAKTKTFVVDETLTNGLQLAVKVADASAGNPSNPKVVLTLKGSTT